VTDRPAPAVLVIGVGSELRTDDAAGRRVAAVLAAREITDVEVRSVHQLTPELATELAGRTHVVFVDASVDVDEVTVRPLDPMPSGRVLTHHLDPSALLALAGRLDGGPQAATAVHVPVHDLGLGSDLTPGTAAAVDDAVDRIIELVATGPDP
jgi:hydrogenase maturation protease